MKRLLWGLFTAVVTLAVLIGVCMLLSDKKPEETALPVETTVAVTEATEETLLTEVETLPMEVPAEVKNTYDSVPRYYQTDYPYIKFGNGTIATSGCSITCLAMIATYMNDVEYTPPQMAYHFGRYGKNNIARLDYGLSEMQLPYHRTSSVQDVLQALKEGKVAIVMMDEESDFTNEQHFIVIAGRTEDKKYIVHDPMETHYLNADVYVKNCYENGFESYQLSRGFSGGWIFDKASYPTDHFVFDASMPEQKENRYGGYVLTGDDIYTLACFVWAEAREEPPIVQQAVAEVVLNRVMSDKYPQTVEDVIKQTEFYRSVGAMAYLDEPEQDQYIAVDAAMYGPYILPENICFYSQWETGKGEWGSLGRFNFYETR